MTKMLLRWGLGAAVLLVAATAAGMGMMHGGMMNEGTTPGARATDESGHDDANIGRQLVRQYCARCHAPPSPSQHTAAQWPSVIRRMEFYMSRQGLRRPTADQAKAIEDYLEHDEH